MVLQNMKLRYESGDLSPNLMQFENLLQTAIFYQQRCRQMHDEIEDLHSLKIDATTGIDPTG